MVMFVLRLIAIFVCVWCGVTRGGAAEVEHKSPNWTPYPLLRKEVKGRTQVRILPMDRGSWEIEWFPPTLGHDALAVPVTRPLTAAGATLEAHGGNYHWISAHSSHSGEDLTLGTVHYFGSPGPSPQAMLGYPKSRLEIMPNPLPREFSTYRSGELWVFQVRFDQKVLPNRVVTLYTPGQPQQRLTTDGQGVLRVVFPAFLAQHTKATSPPASHRRPVQPFQLVVGNRVGDKQFTTVFQYEYGPAPLANRHSLLGWLTTGLGMVGGMFLWRPRRGKSV